MLILRVVSEGQSAQNALENIMQRHILCTHRHANNLAQLCNSTSLVDIYHPTTGAMLQTENAKVCTRKASSREEISYHGQG